MARHVSAEWIINQCLKELALEQVIDPFSSSDMAVTQMTALLTTCGEELIKLYGWERFQQEHVIVTQETDTGKYPLPDDFDHMINQTGWSRTQRVRLPGSVSPQIWQYLRGRNLVSSTIYCVFRNVQGEFWVYPQPPDASVPAGLTLAFEYASRGWVYNSTTQTYSDTVTDKAEIIQLDRILITRLLKLRFREARGMNSVAANNEFLQMFEATSSQDVAAYPINAAGMSQPYPYLDMHRNTPDSGYGF